VQTIRVLTHAGLGRSERIRVAAKFLALTLKTAIARFDDSV
jgi:hypothetical protein